MGTNPNVRFQRLLPQQELEQSTLLFNCHICRGGGVYELSDDVSYFLYKLTLKICRQHNSFITEQNLVGGSQQEISTRPTSGNAFVRRKGAQVKAKMELAYETVSLPH